MIRVIIFNNNENRRIGFRCSGHAEFAAHGQDIVCAAISMLAINTVNSIQTLTKDSCKVIEKGKKGFLECKITSALSREAEILLDSFYLGITGIAQNYGPKFIQINNKEV